MAIIDIGATIGSYRIIAELGQGGMAHLFLALQTQPDGSAREVAIKVIRREHLEDRAFIEMFLDEGRIASYVNDPRVVRVIEVGQVGTTYFMAMEFLHSVTLATFLKELYRMGRRPTPEFAVAICTQVAEALHAAHQTRDETGASLEVVHRDVSPSNILLTCSGSVKLIDFGIAKARGRLHKTRHGRTKGKLRYMSPEQMRGQSVDRRSDIWALGVVLWETLATRRLYGRSRDLEVVRSALAGRLQPPGAYADVPFAVDEAVMRCLTADLASRPSSAGAVAELLRQASPEAAAVREQDLSALVWAVCGHVLDSRARTLPVELPTRASLTNLEPKPAAALRRFSEFLDEADDATVVGGIGEEDLAAIARAAQSRARAKAEAAASGGAQSNEEKRPGPLRPPRGRANTGAGTDASADADPIADGAATIPSTSDALRPPPARQARRAPVSAFPSPAAPAPAKRPAVIAPRPKGKAKMRLHGPLLVVLTIVVAFVAALLAYFLVRLT